MRTKHCSRARLLSRLIPLIAFTALSPSLFAQAATTDAATLAKYDKNKNGRLDPDELAAMQAAEAKPPKVTSAKSDSARDEVVSLSPFEVKSDNAGYYGANTTAGTRMNSNLEDLASSTSIVTKQQMADFAALNINDIFAYEVSTEGSGTFSDAAYDNKGSPVDNVSTNPNIANRIRGVGQANVALGNYASNNLVPVDPIAIDGVEISRGPNSSIFGIGEVSGTVNLQPASANLKRDRSSVQFRADSYDGYRTSLDMNRVLWRDKLAVRGSVVFQHDGYERKPSGVDSVRLNGMLRYQPFSKTILTLSGQKYRSSGTLVNQTMPRDGMADWKAAGSPTWDPITQTIKKNGTAVSGGPWTTTNLPSYFTNSQFIGTSTLFVQQDGTVSWYGPSRTTSTTNPNTANQNVFYVNTAPSSIRTNQPLFAADPVISDKAIYDYSSINLAATNLTQVKQATYVAQLEQTLIQTSRHLLAVQGGFFRENGVRETRDMMGRVGSGGPTGYLFTDVNERYLDGTPNPNFLRPFLGVYQIRERRDDFSQRDTGRLQAAYRLDLRGENNILHWLGMHTLSWYNERRRSRTRVAYFQDDINDSHSWYPFPTTPTRATVFTVPAMAAQPFYRFYVGDTQGGNIDYAPHMRIPGQTTFTWGDGLTGKFNREPVNLDYQYVFNNTLGWDSNILKTNGGTFQSYLLKDRVITTFGFRKDQTWSRSPAARTYTFGPDGYALDQGSIDVLSTAAATVREGKTRQAGVVIKVMPWLRVHANKSNSFTPPSLVQYSLFRDILPNPYGKGEDYGVSTTLFGGKLVARVSRYSTLQIKSRTSPSGGTAQRVQGIDLPTASYIPGSNLFTQAKGWVTRAAAAKGQTLSPDQLDQQVGAIVKLDPVYWNDERSNSLTYAPSDVESRGYEFELNYNPSRNWTFKFNATETEAIDKNISKDIADYVALRMPIWTSVIDPEKGTPWWTTKYSDAQTPAQFYQSGVSAPFNVAVATEGKSRPQIRKYRFNLLSSYKLAGLSGLTDHRWLKNMTVGGALRWEDKGAIGYYGITDAAGIYQSLDAKRPVFDSSRSYIDLFTTYRTKLFRDRLDATFQLNVRNVQENGGLRAISAYPDGTPNAYRIVDPRQFILSVTFDL